MALVVDLTAGAAVLHPADASVSKDAGAAHQKRAGALMRRPQFSSALAALVLILAGAPYAAAQRIAEPDTTTARVRFGPLAMNPTLELTNLGFDTNVFNEPADLAKRDFTFTVSPRTDLWLRVGPTWFTGNVREDILWYQTYDSERSANTSGSVGLIAPLNRFAFSANVGYLRGRDRPGFEIDARVRRKDVSVSGTAEVRAFSRTFFGVQGSKKTIAFDEGETFLNSDLHRELNRTTMAGAVTVRHDLTPLTSITFDAGRAEDRFEFSPLRDATSTTAGVQVSFDPAAVIRGTARFGYRSFEPVSSDLDKYRGSTAAMNLGYVPLGTTRFDVQAMRDIQYSFDVDQPFYIQTGFGVSIAQQVYGPVDVVAGFSRYDLAYRVRAGAIVPFEDRTDRMHSYHGGFGYHIGPEMRIGWRIEKQERLSEIALRAYNGIRVGVSVTYGL